MASVTQIAAVRRIQIFKSANRSIFFPQMTAIHDLEGQVESSNYVSQLAFLQKYSRNVNFCKLALA
jgi:hypothetical protein